MEVRGKSENVIRIAKDFIQWWFKI